MKNFLPYLLLPAAIFATPAAAQDQSRDDDTIIIDDPRVGDLSADDIVVTATGVAQRAEDVGQAITRIDRKTIEQRQTVSIADLLATTPGVTVTRNGGVGTFTSVRIRGAEAEQTLVLIDGVRVNDPSSPGGGFDFGTLLAGSVDHIELLRGPNSVPWGSQAFGGVVNIVTTPATQALSARAQVEAGSFGTVYATSGISGSSGPVRASLNGGYYRSDGISAVAGGAERDGFDQYGVTGRVEVALSPDIALDLRGYFAHSRTALDGFPPPTYSFADTAEYSTSQEIYAYAGLHARSFGGALDNQLGVTFSDINRDNFDPTTSPSLEFLGRGRAERYSYQGNLRLDPVQIVFGAEDEESHFNDGFTFASTAITSGYGQLIVKPVEQLTLTGGIRYDAHRTFGDHVTFGADAAFHPTRNTTIRASYGEGFKAPTLYQLYGDFGTIGLQPETARNYDVGIEQRALGNTLRAALTWFHRDTTNQIDFDLSTFTYANIAQARSQGIEFELELHPVQALTVTGSYSYIDAINRSPGANFGRDLARRPKHTISASADYRFPFGLSVGGTISHVGDSYDDAGNNVRLDGYELVGVRAELPVGQRFALYGRVDNLFDARYQVVSGYGTYGRAAYGGVRVKLN